MSTVLNWLFAGADHENRSITIYEEGSQDYYTKVQDRPLITENLDFIISAVGKKNISFVKSVEDENINRFAIYGTAYDNHSLYLDIFQRLHPSVIWIQDDSGKNGSSEIVDKINENGGNPQVGPYLMWSQAPGKIYCAYPSHRENRFFVERFIPNATGKTNYSGITTIETTKQLQTLVENQLNLDHHFEWWNNPKNIMDDPHKNPDLHLFVKILDHKDELEREIEQIQSELYEIPPGKKDRKKRLSLAQKISDLQLTIQKNEHVYNSGLWDFGYSDVNPDPIGLRQRHEFNNTIKKLDDMRATIDLSEQGYNLSSTIEKAWYEQNQAKYKSELQTLKNKYIEAFDALI